MVVGVALGFAGIVLTARPWSAPTTRSTSRESLDADGRNRPWTLLCLRPPLLSPANLPPLALSTWQIGLALLLLLLLTDFTGIGQILQDWRAAVGVVIGLGVLGTGTAF